MTIMISFLVFYLFTICSSSHLNELSHNELAKKLVLKSFYPELWYQVSKGSKEYDSEAAVWLDDFNDQLHYYNSREATISWNFETNMTNKTSKALSDFAPKKSMWMKQKKLEAAKFDITKLDRSRTRMLYVIRNLSFSFMDEKFSKKNSDLINKMSEIYSTTKVKLPGGTLASGEPDLARIMHNSKNYEDLLYAWKSWRDTVGPKIKKLYPQLISVENEAVKLQGYEDVGEVWRSQYEVKDLEGDAKKIWEDLKPLYKELHAYVRRKLSDHYGRDKVDVTGPIPAHLLGNMWAQEWGGLIDIVKPYEANVSDITEALKQKNYNVEKIFKTAEDFYVSIGLYPMTEKFWKLSMLKDPGGPRKVDCHGSAEDFSSEDDFRIKMCTEINADSFITAHHEMGHIQYFMSYSQQPEVFKAGANPAFHEAIGDSVVYSVLTPEHLKRIGLMENSSSSYEADINFLMYQALRSFVLIPWTLMVDLWRYDVFRGKIDESNFNSEWWKYRLEFQGLKPPVERNESHFDPGAKFHIPYHVPYIRYFFAKVLQMQFHAKMCELAYGLKKTTKLHRCDVYGSKNAGKHLKNMMSLGSSRPWWDALQVMTGSSKLDASPILEYFQPLRDWLRKENKKNNEVIGW